MIPLPNYVPSENPYDWGYHGGELAYGEESYAANQDYTFWRGVIKDSNDRKFETTDEAAEARAKILILATEETGWEWGENIYRDPRGAIFTGDPLTSMSGRNLFLRERFNDAKRHPGNKWLGGIHTHPRDRSSNYMEVSNDDKKYADLYGWITYVASDPNYLYRYDSKRGPIRLW